MPRGGYRPGSGPKKGTKYRTRGTTKTPQVKKEIPPDIVASAVKENLTPLEFMLREMNDTSLPWADRARMAATAAPFVHARAGEGKGKKGEQAEAAKNAAGRFSQTSAPKIVQIK
jgi:hypothetical protein